MIKVFGEDYTYTPGKDYSNVKLEPQASIVEDWYARNDAKGLPAEGYGLNSQKAMTDQLFRYISQNLRTARARDSAGTANHDDHENSVLQHPLP